MTMKLILSLIFAFAAAWGFSARLQEERDLFWKPLKKGRKTVLLFPLLLPCFLLLLLCFQLFLPSADFLSPIALILLGYLSLYFALLLLLLPLLRRFFSAKACASLWLLPNLLYLLFNLDRMFAPRIILPLPFASALDGRCMAGRLCTDASMANGDPPALSPPGAERRHIGDR